MLSISSYSAWEMPTKPRMRSSEEKSTCALVLSLASGVKYLHCGGTMNNTRSMCFFQ